MQPPNVSKVHQKRLKRFLYALKARVPLRIIILFRMSKWNFGCLESASYMRLFRLIRNC